MAELPTYSPPFAPHVVGRYTRREYDEVRGVYEPQTVTAECRECGGRYGPAECASGQPRGHIDRWAVEHLHRDVMTPRALVKVGKP